MKNGVGCFGGESVMRRRVHAMVGIKNLHGMMDESVMSIRRRTPHVGVRMVSRVGVRAVRGLIRVGHGKMRRRRTVSGVAGAAGRHVTAVGRGSAILRVGQFVVAVALHHGHAGGAVVILLRHIPVHLVVIVTVGVRVTAAATAIVAVVLHVVAGAVIAFDVTTARVRTKAHLVGTQRTTQGHAHRSTTAATTPRHLLTVT